MSGFDKFSHDGQDALPMMDFSGIIQLSRYHIFWLWRPLLPLTNNRHPLPPPSHPRRCSLLIKLSWFWLSSPLTSCKGATSFMTLLDPCLIALALSTFLPLSIWVPRRHYSPTYITSVPHNSAGATSLIAGFNNCLQASQDALQRTGCTSVTGQELSFSKSRRMMGNTSSRGGHNGLPRPANDVGSLGLEKPQRARRLTDPEDYLYFSNAGLMVLQRHR